MHPTLTRLLHGGIAATVVGACLLAVNPAPAHALPAYSNSEVGIFPFVRDASGNCTATGAADPPSVVPMVENGPAAITTVSTTATYEENGVPANTITTTSTLRSTSASTSSGGVPRSVRTSFTGSITATSSSPASPCQAIATASVSANVEFTTSTPLWATLSISRKGPVLAVVEVMNLDGLGYERLTSTNFDSSSGSLTTLLPPGHYESSVAGRPSLYVDRTLAAPRTLSGSAAVTFAPIGSASTAPSGKAKKYVALPAARSCASHNATAALTGKKKKIKKIDKVTYEVNGKKAAALKGKKVKKNKTAALAIADNKAATITATVLLDSGKKKTVTASYLACSA